jgi:predicted DNA-binding transcriptional regulator AlpA
VKLSADGPLDDLLSAQQLADYLGVPVATVYFWNRVGTGPKRFRAGRHIRYRKADVHPAEEERTSSQNKDKYTVAHCSFVVCLTCKKAWSDTDVGGKVLGPRLFTAESEIVAVGLFLGEAKGDRNPPILPEDPVTDEVEDVQAAFAKYATRLPSGRVVFDVVQYNADNAPPPEPPAAA